MKAALEKIGFEVILKIDAGRSGIREAVRTFGDRIQRGGVDLFYYVGHGIQVDGVNYIIPVGVDIKREYDVEDQALRMNYVLGAMEAANNQLNIVILDVCRDNPLRSINSFRCGSTGLAAMEAPIGTIIAFATAAGRKAEDGTGRNGTFMASLLKHLTRPGVSVTNMFNYAGLEVMKQTRNTQVPWTSSTPVPRFFLARGAPEDQDLRPEPPQPHPAAPDKAQLYVMTDPGGGQVQIMNIVDKYYDSIELDPGRYKLEGSMEGFRTKTMCVWTDSGWGNILNIISPGKILPIKRKGEQNCSPVNTTFMIAGKKKGLDNIDFIALLVYK